jgi:hypothetical protein
VPLAELVGRTGCSLAAPSLVPRASSEAALGWEPSLVEGSVDAIAEEGVGSPHRPGVKATCSHVEATCYAPGSRCVLAKAVAAVPKFGARVADDGFGLGACSCSHPAPMTRADLHARRAAFEDGSYGFGVGEVLVGDPRHVVQVPHSEERQTCC